MAIIIVAKQITKGKLQQLTREGYGDIVKAVVDLKKEIMAVGGEMHVDEEQLLLEQGSKQADLWGINIYSDKKGEAMVEFDSVINIRPRQNNHSRYVESETVRRKILVIVRKLVK